MIDDEDKYFTVVFQGDIRKIKGNPLLIESKFGKVLAVGRGDAFSEIDFLKEQLENCDDEG